MTMKLPSGDRKSRKTPGLVARTLFGVWLGFMIATAGIALYPRLGQVSAAILCHGSMQLDTHHYLSAPGRSVTTRDFYCADGVHVGLAPLVLTTWLAYAVAVFVLAELIVLLGRRFPPVERLSVQAALFLLLFCAAVAVALNLTAPLVAYTPTVTVAPASAAAKSTIADPVLADLPHACDVLSDAIAKKAIGASAHVTRKAQPNRHETQCLYVSGGGSINLMVGDWPTIHRSSSFFGGEEAVPGIGEEAYLSKMHRLVVRKGERGFELGVIGPSGEYWGQAADDQITRGVEAQKKLAQELVSRL
jgi:hypothetical protein